MHIELTVARLRELLAYDPEAGVFVWLVGRGRAAAGAVAGTLARDGYLRIGVDGQGCAAHRLAWLMHYGEWPTGQIDHRDGCRTNNRIANLRDVTTSVNNQNQRKARADNKSCGLLGVTANCGRWMAQIQVDRKKRRLGLFDTPERAHAAYLEAKRELHEGCTI